MREYVHYLLHARMIKDISVKQTSILILAGLSVVGVLVINSPIPLISVNGQATCDNGRIIGSDRVLPVILVHGYNENSGIWFNWETFLEHDNIPYCTVSFHGSDDECGTAANHGNELIQIIQQVKSLTGQNRVNIVGHSKGGLDARVYLARNSGSHDVVSLIMIGTPNGGDPLANRAASFPLWDYLNLFCRPALYDLEVGASDTKVKQNQHTNYYTIYGDWYPSLDCPLRGYENFGYWRLIGMNSGRNDGVVPTWSVKSLINSTNLGHTNHCHTGLLDREEYDIAKSILMPIT